MRALLILSVVLGLSVQLIDSLKLQILPSGNVVRPVNEAFAFTCKALNVDSGTDPQLAWFDPDSQQITSTDRRYLETNAGDKTVLKLIFYPVSEMDYGTYMCRSKTFRNVRPESALMIIYKKITWDDCAREQHPAIYQDGLIRCVVSGSPAPQVTWSYRKNENSPRRPITIGDRYQIGNKGLSIKNMTEADNGIYTCTAEVELKGDIQPRAITVEVYTPPKITMKPKLLNPAIAQKGVTIVCEATGKPLPKFALYRANMPDTPLIGDKYSQEDKFQGKFTIWNLESSDSGDYICEAKNDLSHARATVTINVIEPPRIYRYYDKRPVIGEDVSLHCEVQAKPAATIEFLKVYSKKPYVEGFQPNDKRIQIVSKTGELFIKNVSRFDTGNYTCIARNAGGETRVNKTIIVEYPPEFVKDQPAIIYHWPGHVKNITCEVYAEPRPSFSWWHGLNQILPKNPDAKNDTFKIIDNFNYTISILQVKIRPGMESWIFGPYECRASNKLAARTYTSTYKFTLQQAHRPEDPESITAKATPTTILVKVEKPKKDGGVPIKGYQMTWQKGANSLGWNQPLSFGLDEPLYLKNLQSETLYLVKVMAINDVGTSDGRNIQVKTLTIREPDAVEITSSKVSTDPYSHVLGWKKPQNGGLMINSYKIEYRQVAVDENEKYEKALSEFVPLIIKADPNLQEYVLSDLKPNTYYQARVFAVNDRGWSKVDAKNDGIFRTLSDPAAALAAHNMSTGTIIAIVITVFLIFLIIIDVSCYFMNECGILNHICVNFCGKGHTKVRERSMEEGMSKELVKEEEAPPSDDDSKPPDATDQMAIDEKEDLKKAQAQEEAELNNERNAYKESEAQEMDNDKRLMLENQDELEPDEKSPLTGENNVVDDELNKQISIDGDHYEGETTPSQKASPQGSPKETSPIIA
ncbi:neural cell adhesion molecule 2-like isoform X2 [Tubulanus polymorphus]|uniref:neural cell adhesion molecule 2-like isoform X2 n=1 Tax=Tubulanus polymorphus TaxID=672921 RepID=UPI003DA48911